MAPKNNSLEIPEGWILNTRFNDVGLKVQGFLCPETGQEFYTYEDLMRYVRYAKEAQLSIYAPDSEFNKKKRAEAMRNASPSSGLHSSVTEPGERSTAAAESSGSTKGKKGKKKQQRKRK